MVNNEMSEEMLGETGDGSGGDCPETSTTSSDSQTTSGSSPSAKEADEPASSADENVRLSPTSLFCSVPLNRDVQTIIDTFPKTEAEKAGGKKTRKIPCLYCDRTFVADNLRQKHVERSHSIKQARRSSSRFQQSTAAVACLFCNKFTLTENKLGDLFRHLVAAHPGKYFGCLECQERFASQGQLEEHNAHFHGIKREVKVQCNEEASEASDVKTNSAITDSSVVKTRHKAKIKEDSEQSDGTKPVVRRGRPQILQKELRHKKISIKSTKLGIKRSARLQTKVMPGKGKKRPKQKERVPEEPKSDKDKEKEVKVSSTENPYPTFDAFYRVKKITDHSIDNLRITSLTFNDVFDQAFYNRIKCNIRENLLNHLDGKLFKNEESESRISNFEKTQTEQPSSENYGCEISLNAATPIATSLLTAQFGDDPESQIEYGSKASKKKSTPKQDEVHYKYFTRRKYQASILESKENRDLSKLDMWTQLVIKRRQQKIVQDSKTDREKLDYKKGEEYRGKKQNQELNRILDRRGPFEDLKEEASKKAAMEGNLNQEAYSDVTFILEDLLGNVFSKVAEDAEIKTELTDSEIPSYLNLRKTSLTNDSYIDKSDKITLICSSQETENFEAPDILPKDKNALVELSGEWARSRLYICAACGLKLANMKLLIDHKNLIHQNVWCQHYEFVGNQEEFYKNLSIPGLGKMEKIENNCTYKVWKRSEARVCTKCAKQCNSLGELHRHVLECGEDWSWMLVRKKCKYKPFGAKTRKKRRGLFKRIIHKEKPTEENREKKTYKKEGPRVKPSDADTIQRMLANLPAKRATRKIMCLKDGFPKISRKTNYKKKTPETPTTVVNIKTKKQNMRMRRNRVELLMQESNNLVKGKRRLIKGMKCNPVNNTRKSMRNLNKVISSAIIDNNSTLMKKRKLKNAIQQQRMTRRSKQPVEASALQDEVDSGEGKEVEEHEDEIEIKKQQVEVKKLQVDVKKQVQGKNQQVDVKKQQFDGEKQVEVKKQQVEVKKQQDEVNKQQADDKNQQVDGKQQQVDVKKQQVDDKKQVEVKKQQVDDKKPVEVKKQQVDAKKQQVDGKKQVEAKKQQVEAKTQQAEVKKQNVEVKNKQVDVKKELVEVKKHQPEKKVQKVVKKKQVEDTPEESKPEEVPGIPIRKTRSASSLPEMEEFSAPEKLESPAKKKLCKKTKFGKKLMRTLSLRKKKTEAGALSAKDETADVNETSNTDTENTKNNGKRKSRLDSIKNAVKKIRLVKDAQRSQKENVEAAAEGHFLESGASVTAAETVTPECETKTSDDKTVIADKSENESEKANASIEPEPVVACDNSVEEAAASACETVTQITETAEAKQPPASKPKLCKRSKGLNACIAMLTNKLQQKDGEAPVNLVKRKVIKTPVVPVVIFPRPICIDLDVQIKEEIIEEVNPEHFDDDLHQELEREVNKAIGHEVPYAETAGIEKELCVETAVVEKNLHVETPERLAVKEAIDTSKNISSKTIKESMEFNIIPKLVVESKDTKGEFSNRKTFDESKKAKGNYSNCKTFDESKETKGNYSNPKTFDESTETKGNDSNPKAFDESKEITAKTIEESLEISNIPAKIVEESKEIKIHAKTVKDPKEIKIHSKTIEESKEIDMYSKSGESKEINKIHSKTTEELKEINTINSKSVEESTEIININFKTIEESKDIINTTPKLVDESKVPRERSEALSKEINPETLETLDQNKPQHEITSETLHLSPEKSPETIKAFNLETPVEEKENIVLEQKPIEQNSPRKEEVRLEKVVDIIKCFEDINSKENINGHNKNGLPKPPKKPGKNKKKQVKVKQNQNQIEVELNPTKSLIESKLNTAILEEDDAPRDNLGVRKIGQRRTLPKRSTKSKQIDEIDKSIPLDLSSTSSEKAKPGDEIVAKIPDGDDSIPAKPESSKSADVLIKPKELIIKKLIKEPKLILDSSFKIQTPIKPVNFAETNLKNLSKFGFPAEGFMGVKNLIKPPVINFPIEKEIIKPPILKDIIALCESNPLIKPPVMKDLFSFTSEAQSLIKPPVLNLDLKTSEAKPLVLEVKPSESVKKPFIKSPLLKDAFAFPEPRVGDLMVAKLFNPLDKINGLTDLQTSLFKPRSKSFGVFDKPEIQLNASLPNMKTNVDEPDVLENKSFAEKSLSIEQVKPLSDSEDELPLAVIAKTKDVIQIPSVVPKNLQSEHKVLQVPCLKARESKNFVLQIPTIVNKNPVGKIKESSIVEAIEANNERIQIQEKDIAQSFAEFLKQNSGEAKETANSTLLKDKDKKKNKKKDKLKKQIDDFEETLMEHKSLIDFGKKKSKKSKAGENPESQAGKESEVQGIQVRESEVFKKPEPIITKITIPKIHIVQKRDNVESDDSEKDKRNKKKDRKSKRTEAMIDVIEQEILRLQNAEKLLKAKKHKSKKLNEMVDLNLALNLELQGVEEILNLTKSKKKRDKSLTSTNDPDKSLISTNVSDNSLTVINNPSKSLTSTNDSYKSLTSTNYSNKALTSTHASDKLLTLTNYSNPPLENQSNPSEVSNTDNNETINEVIKENVLTPSEPVTKLIIDKRRLITTGVDFENPLKPRKTKNKKNEPNKEFDFSKFDSETVALIKNLENAIQEEISVENNLTLAVKQAEVQPNLEELTKLDDIKNLSESLVIDENLSVSVEKVLPRKKEKNKKANRVESSTLETSVETPSPVEAIEVLKDQNLKDNIFHQDQEKLNHASDNLQRQENLKNLTQSLQSREEHTEISESLPKQGNLDISEALPKQIKVKDRIKRLQKQVKMKDTTETLQKRVKVNDTIGILQNELNVKDTIEILQNELKVKDTIETLQSTDLTAPSKTEKSRKKISNAGMSSLSESSEDINSTFSDSSSSFTNSKSDFQRTISDESSLTNTSEIIVSETPKGKRRGRKPKNKANASTEKLLQNVTPDFNKITEDPTLNCEKDVLIIPLASESRGVDLLLNPLDEFCLKPVTSKGKKQKSDSDLNTDDSTSEEIERIFAAARDPATNDEHLMPSPSLSRKQRGRKADFGKSLSFDDWSESSASSINEENVKLMPSPSPKRGRKAKSKNAVIRKLDKTDAMESSSEETSLKEKEFLILEESTMLSTFKEKELVISKEAAMLSTLKEKELLISKLTPMLSPLIEKGLLISKETPMLSPSKEKGLSISEETSNTLPLTEKVLFISEETALPSPMKEKELLIIENTDTITNLQALIEDEEVIKVAIPPVKKTPAKGRRGKNKKSNYIQEIAVPQEISSDAFTENDFKITEDSAKSELEPPLPSPRGRKQKEKKTIEAATEYLLQTINKNYSISSCDESTNDTISERLITPSPSRGRKPKNKKSTEVAIQPEKRTETVSISDEVVNDVIIPDQLIKGRNRKNKINNEVFKDTNLKNKIEREDLIDLSNTTNNDAVNADETLNDKKVTPSPSRGRKASKNKNNQNEELAKDILLSDENSEKIQDLVTLEILTESRGRKQKNKKINYNESDDDVFNFETDNSQDAQFPFKRTVSYLKADVKEQNAVEMQKVTITFPKNKRQKHKKACSIENEVLEKKGQNLIEETEFDDSKKDNESLAGCKEISVEENLLLENDSETNVIKSAISDFGGEFAIIARESNYKKVKAISFIEESVNEQKLEDNTVPDKVKEQKLELNLIEESVIEKKTDHHFLKENANEEMFELNFINESFNQNKLSYNFIEESANEEKMGPNFTEKTVVRKTLKHTATSELETATIINLEEHSVPTIINVEETSVPTIVSIGENSVPTIVTIGENSVPTIVNAEQDSATTTVNVEQTLAPTIVKVAETLALTTKGRKQKNKKINYNEVSENALAIEKAEIKEQEIPITPRSRKQKNKKINYNEDDFFLAVETEKTVIEETVKEIPVVSKRGRKPKNKKIEEIAPVEIEVRANSENCPSVSEDVTQITPRARKQKTKKINYNETLDLFDFEEETLSKNSKQKKADLDYEEETLLKISDHKKNDFDYEEEILPKISKPKNVDSVYEEETLSKITKQKKIDLDYQEEILPKVSKQKKVDLDYEEETLSKISKQKKVDLDYQEEILPKISKQKKIDLDYQEKILPKISKQKKIDLDYEEEIPNISKQKVDCDYSEETLSMITKQKKIDCDYEEEALLKITKQKNVNIDYEEEALLKISNQKIFECDYKEETISKISKQKKIDHKQETLLKISNQKNIDFDYEEESLSTISKQKKIDFDYEEKSLSKILKQKKVDCEKAGLTFDDNSKQNDDGGNKTKKGKSKKLKKFGLNIEEEHANKSKSSTERTDCLPNIEEDDRSKHLKTDTSIFEFRDDLDEDFGNEGLTHKKKIEETKNGVNKVSKVDSLILNDAIISGNKAVDKDTSLVNSITTDDDDNSDAEPLIKIIDKISPNKNLKLLKSPRKLNDKDKSDNDLGSPSKIKKTSENMTSVFLHQTNESLEKALRTNENEASSVNHDSAIFDFDEQFTDTELLSSSKLDETEPAKVLDLKTLEDLENTNGSEYDEDESKIADDSKENADSESEEVSNSKHEDITETQDPSNRSRNALKLKQPFNKKKKSKLMKKKELQLKNIETYCEICDKNFVRSDSLIKHKRTLTHIAKLSEIEAREAEERAKKEEQVDKMEPVITPPPFTLKTNNDTLKLADIISDVLNKPVVEESSEKRYKSLGERKSFDSDSLIFNPPATTFNNHLNTNLIENKLPSSTGAFLETQISLLENIIENKGNFSYIDDISNKSDERCSSDMSLVSDIKQDDSNIISFSHNTSIVSSIMHSETNFVKPGQYEEISEDTRNFEEQRARKALNRDEELFLECCSLLKSSSEVSDYSKKSGKTHAMVNTYGLKTGQETDWLEHNNLIAKQKPYPNNEDYLSDDNSRVDTPIGDNYDDFSNSNTIRTEWNSKGKDGEFEDISLDSLTDSENNSSFNNFGVNFDGKQAVEKTVEEHDDKHTDDDKFDDIMDDDCLDIDEDDDEDVEDIIETTESSQKPKSPVRCSQQPITNFTVPLPKSSDSSSTSDSKKVMTKGAMKVFEGLKVSIPTEELDLAELLNCSPTAKKPDAVVEPKQKPEVEKLKDDNLNKFGNKLGLKITKRRAKPRASQERKLVEEDGKVHDVYDFEETQDNSDLFIPNNLKTFRTQLAEKKEEVKEAEPEVEESDLDSNNHYVDSFSVEAQSVSSFSTETESSLSMMKKNTGVKNITKKKCVIMGRIFKNAFKAKTDEIKDIPPADNAKLVENYVMSCPDVAGKTGERIKMTEQEMDLLFDKLLEDDASALKKKQEEEEEDEEDDADLLPPPPIDKKEEKSVVLAPVVVKKQEGGVKGRPKGAKKKRARKQSQSSDDEFNLNKTVKRRAGRKKVKDNGINLEQELKECMGVAGRKSQRKCTSGKQNVLVEDWSSDDSEFEAMLRLSAQQTKPSAKQKVNDASTGENVHPTEVITIQTQKEAASSEEPKTKEEKPVEPNKKIEPISVEFLKEIVKDVADSKPKPRRKSNARKDKEERLPKIKPGTIESTLASNRRKRAAADTLYYWSSSSDDDSQNLIEVKSVRDEIDEDDDRPMQHGWIVGDSPKKLVTMLAQAKGKKIDTKCVKEQSKKRTTI